MFSFSRSLSLSFWLCLCDSSKWLGLFLYISLFLQYLSTDIWFHLSLIHTFSNMGILCNVISNDISPMTWNRPFPDFLIRVLKDPFKIPPSICKPNLVILNTLEEYAELSYVFNIVAKYNAPQIPSSWLKTPLPFFSFFFWSLQRIFYIPGTALSLANTY